MEITVHNTICGASRNNLTCKVEEWIVANEGHCQLLTICFVILYSNSSNFDKNWIKWFILVFWKRRFLDKSLFTTWNILDELSNTQYNVLMLGFAFEA